MTIALMFSLSSYAKSVDIEIKKNDKMIQKKKFKNMPENTYVDIDLSFDEMKDFTCSLINLGNDVNSVILSCKQKFKSDDVKKEISTNGAFLCDNSFQSQMFVLRSEFKNGSGQRLTSDNSYMLTIKCKGK
jgi:subtilisin-like proprotein convertase family protein